jgi:hypothetical protein
MRSPLEKITRQRGVGLTATGFRKLNQAKLELESMRGLRRYTLEHLSEYIGLT